MIDFSEIKTGEEFENLVFELLRNWPQVKNIYKTGRGADFGADIVFDYEQPKPFIDGVSILKVIVECKHNARSNKAVRKGDVDPIHSLINHTADIYLLVTSTCLGTSLARTFEKSETDPRVKFFYRLEHWDRNDLQRELLKPTNDNTFKMFLPKNYLSYQKLITNNEKQFSTLKEKFVDKYFKEANVEKSIDLKMKSIYLIRNILDQQFLQENLLRKVAEKNGIVLNTSFDAYNDLMFSNDTIMNFDKSIDSADSVFALVTSKSSKSPNLWLELERAKYKNKLKIVFIDENVYSVVLHRDYPCVIISKNLDSTIKDFEDYYRKIFQTLGKDGNEIFWFSLDIILSMFQSTTQN